jgi:hypothetical protein
LSSPRTRRPASDSRRGVYRGLYSALFVDLDYRKLSSSARLVLLTIRQCKEAGLAGIFCYYPAVIAEQTGLTVKQVTLALRELEAGKWIELEGPILWIRNALRYDPNLRLSSPKHLLGVRRALEELPRLSIVLRFCDYYEIGRPFDILPSGYSLGEGEGVGKGVGKALLPPYPPSSAEGGSPPITSDLFDASIDPNDNTTWSSAPWGTPAALAYLYNETTPDECREVQTLSPKLTAGAKKFLKLYPDRAWWEQVFDEVQHSPFLRGQKPGSNGYKRFKLDFAFLFTSTRGEEHAVKMHDGGYRE